MLIAVLDIRLQLSAYRSLFRHPKSQDLNR